MSKQIDNRLSRLAGQLEKLQKIIKEEGDCVDIIPQFLAVKGALAGAFELYVKESIHACADSDQAKMEKLLTLLIKS